MATLIVIMILTLLSSTEARDNRWVSKPESHSVRKVNDSLALRWIYPSPSSPGQHASLLFTHHVPGNTQETILIEATIEDGSNRINITFEKEPGKIELIVNSVKDKELILHFPKVSMEDSGSLLLDIRVPGDVPLHDSIVLNVYDDPMLTATPDDETFSRLGEEVHIVWTLDPKPITPNIETIIFKHQGLGRQGMTPVAEARKTGYSPIWSVNYLDNSSFDRVSFVYNHQSRNIMINIQNLTKADAGTYEIEVKYNMQSLIHKTQLVVSQGCEWREAPASLVFSKPSWILELHFKVRGGDGCLGIISRLQLFKETANPNKSAADNRQKREAVAWTGDTPAADNRQKREAVAWTEDTPAADNRQARVAWNGDGRSFTLIIPNETEDVMESWNIRVWLDQVNVLEHQLDHCVVTDEELKPSLSIDGINKSWNDIIHTGRGMLGVSVPEHLPKPNISLDVLSSLRRPLLRVVETASVQVDLHHYNMETSILTIDYGFHNVSTVLDLGVSDEPEYFNDHSLPLTTSVCSGAGLAIVVFLLVLALYRQKSQVCVLKDRHRGNKAIPAQRGRNSDMCGVISSEKELMNSKGFLI